MADRGRERTVLALRSETILMANGTSGIRQEATGVLQRVISQLSCYPASEEIASVATVADEESRSAMLLRWPHKTLAELFTRLNRAIEKASN
jgi:hypothetical protein